MTALLRRLQQSYIVQTLIAAVLTFLGATAAAMLTFSKGDLFSLSAEQLRSAAGMGAFAGLTYVVGIYQHGPGSARFKADGTVNQSVAGAAALQAKMEAEPNNEQVKAAVQRVATVAAIEAHTSGATW